MPIYTLEGPDGKKYRIEGPEGATADQLAAVIQGGQPPAPQKGNMLGDLAAGAVRGAGSIGATLLAPIDALARKAGIHNDFIGRTDRRESMDAALQGLGANTDSLAYKGAKVGAEIAGTLPVGGVLAKGAAMVPGLARLAPAIASGGISAPGANLLTRAAGGAITGGATAGLVNPEDAGLGAMIGGAMPGAAMAAGKAPFDPKMAAESAATAEFMSKLPWAAFGEGTDKGDTKAKSEIWTDKAKFTEYADKMQAEMSKLNAAVKTGNLDSIKAAVGAVGGSCKTCHDAFRS